LFIVPVVGVYRPR